MALPPELTNIPGMAVIYKGFNLYVIPLAGGHFVRMKPCDWPHRHREAPFAETCVFPREDMALAEARQMIDNTVTLNF